MKKNLYLLLLASVFFTACSKENDLGNPLPPGQPVKGEVISRAPGDRDGGGGYCTETSVNLIAGQNMVAGNVTVQQDADFIYVTYNTTGGWVITQTHLYVGNCATIPVNGAGNPIPGQFPYNANHNNVTTYTVAVPVSVIGIGNCGCIAAHAVVKQLDASGNTIQQQTAWGEGTRINPTGNWAMKFSFCPVACQ
jgi:hypothetical protein